MGDVSSARRRASVRRKTAYSTLAGALSRAQQEFDLHGIERENDSAALRSIEHTGREQCGHVGTAPPSRRAPPHAQRADVGRRPPAPE